MAEITFTKIAEPTATPEATTFKRTDQPEGGGQPETVAEAFRRGFSEGRGGGAPLGGGPMAIATQPIRELTSDVSGVVRGTQEALAASGPLGRDIAALPEAFLGSPGALHLPEGTASQTMEKLFPGASAPGVPSAVHRARGIVSKALGEEQRAGGTTALGVLDKLSEARAAGQPLTISDVGGRAIRRLAGSVYRSGGEPGTYMERFYKGRGTDLTLDHLNTVAGERIEKAISQNIAAGSYRDATKNLIAERSVRARPLWEEATAGGSTAPLEKQFESAFGEASKNEQAAVQRLVQIRNEATQAAARQATAGNVYSASGANRDARAVQQKVRAAEFELNEARRSADEARARLRRAQDDGTANAPGAVWSPRLQQFLDLPEWQEGIKRGLRMERRDAVTENRPFNPSEYAIVGGTETDPVVGAVPTMKLLQVAKEGIASKIDEMRDQMTGGLSKAGRSLWLNLKAFEQEGYSLNPAWKVANDAWSGDSASIRALQLGQKVFSMPLEDLSEDFNAMSASDKELFRLSAASKAVSDVRKTPFAGDPSKRVINNPDEAMRFRVLFDNDADFQNFSDKIQRERLIFETAGDVMKGAQTAERLASDWSTVGHGALTSAGYLLHGHPLAAIPPAMRAVRALRPNPQVNLETAKILTDPNITLTADPTGKLRFGLPQMPPYVPGEVPR